MAQSYAPTAGGQVREFRDSYDLLASIADRLAGDLVAKLRRASRGHREPGFAAPSHAATSLVIYLREAERQLGPKEQRMVGLIQCGYFARFEDDGIDFWGRDRCYFVPGIEGAPAENWLRHNPQGLIDPDECPDLDARRLLAGVCRSIAAYLRVLAPEDSTTEAAFRRAAARAIFGARSAKERAGELVDRLVDSGLAPFADAANEWEHVSDLYKVAERLPPYEVQAWRDERSARFAAIEIEDEPEELPPAPAAAYPLPPADNRVRRFLAYVAARERPDSRPEHPMDSGDHVLQYAGDCVRFGLEEFEAVPLIEQFAGQDPGPQREHLRRNAARKYRDARATTIFGSKLLERDSGPSVELERIMEAGQVVTECEAPPPVARKAEILLPVSVVENMPAVMRDAFEWILSVSIYPMPAAAIGALIPFFGAVLGRKVQDDYRTRTNIYFATLAPTGAGKDRPREAIAEIAARAGALSLLGSESPSSAAGIVTQVESSPSICLPIDEVGKLMQSCNDARASHLVRMRDVLTRAFTSSTNPAWKPDGYRDEKENRTIPFPNLCLSATGVPDDFLQSLSHGNITDGFLPRFVVLQAGYGGRQKPQDVGPPGSVVDWVSAWQKAPSGGNIAEIANPEVIRATKTAEADAIFEAYADAKSAVNFDGQPIEQALWTRAAQKVGRLALIHACCNCVPPSVPVITEQSVRWGIEIVDHSTQWLAETIRNSVASSPYQAAKLKVWNAVVDGMGLNALTRATQWIKKRERAEILDDLIAVGAIQLEEVPSGGRKGTVIRKTRSAL
jgi:hypothetical protein